MLGSYQTAVARNMALLFLKGVRMGSPMRAFAMTLPEKMTSMDESHSESGCFREKVSPAATDTTGDHVNILLSKSSSHSDLTCTGGRKGYWTATKSRCYSLVKRYFSQLLQVLCGL